MRVTTAVDKYMLGPNGLIGELDEEVSTVCTYSPYVSTYLQDMV